MQIFLYRAIIYINNREVLTKEVEMILNSEKSGIMRAKELKMLDVIDGLLLGDINANGEYILSENIKKELIKMPKVKKAEYGGFMFLESIFPIKSFGKVLFSLNFIKEEKSNKVNCELKLLEEMEKGEGYLINTQSTLIASKNITDTKTNRENILAEFNIYIDEADGGRLITDEDYFYGDVYRKKAFLKRIKVESSTIIEKTEKKKFEEKVKLLEKFEKGKDILVKYEVEVIRATKNNKGELSYKSKSEILSAVIEREEKGLRNDLAGIKTIEKLDHIEKAKAKELEKVIDQKVFTSSEYKTEITPVKTEPKKVVNEVNKTVKKESAKEVIEKRKTNAKTADMKKGGYWKEDNVKEDQREI